MLILPQISKKTATSSAAPIKFIITKTVNSKGLSAQTAGSPVIAGGLTSNTVNCCLVQAIIF